MTNRVVHFEIQVDDLERAKKFYTDVFGWTYEKWMDEPAYWGIRTAPAGSEDKGIDGGFIDRRGPLPIKGQAVNAYVCTLAVDDFDATALKIEKAGGSVALPKFAIPKMAWQGYFTDTEGNIFGIHQPDEQAI